MQPLTKAIPSISLPVRGLAREAAIGTAALPFVLKLIAISVFLPEGLSFLIF